MLKIMTITRFEQFDEEIKLNDFFPVLALESTDFIKIGRKVSKLGFQDFSISDLQCYVSSILSVTCIHGTIYIKYNVSICIK